MLQKNDIANRIPANKFYPPRLDQSQILYRKKLIDSHIRKKGKNKKIIIFEAQAGQGKTTSAIQFLNIRNTPYAWYQIGPEDADPVVTLTSLLFCCKRALKNFSSPLLEKIIQTGDISIIELTRYTNIFLNDLSRFLTHDFHLVLDDFHLLENHLQTNLFFEYFMETAPPDLHFLLLTRRPIHITNKIFNDHINTLKITNNSFAFTEQETAELFNDIFKINQSLRTVRKLHLASAGWIMGLVLLAHSFEEHGQEGQQIDLLNDPAHKGGIHHYFRKEIFSQIPPHLYMPLLKLSLLDEIPLPLAEKICNEPNIGGLLADLNKQNFFVRSLDDADTIFSFHHLLREFLLERALKELEPENIFFIRREAAAFYLTRKNIEKTLNFLLDSEDYDSIEMVLDMYGMDLIAMNRILTLHDILIRIPISVILKRGWLSFFYGSTLMELDPPQAKNFLFNANSLFQKENIEHGELMASAQLIYFQMYCGGEYKNGAGLLPRTHYLFSKHIKEINEFPKLLISKNIAYGYCFFTSDQEKAHAYASLAHTLAAEQKINNLMAATQGILIFEKYFAGDLKACQKELEKGFYYLYDPKVSELNRLTIFGAMLNFFDDTGDQENYLKLESILQKSINKDLISMSVVGPYLALWNIHMAISNGWTAQALLLIDKSMDNQYIAHNPHLSSQFYHFKAYALALLGKKNESLTVAQQSLKAMKTGGGNHYFGILNSLIIASTFIQLGLYEEAEPILVHALKLSIQNNQFFLRASTYLQRANMHLQREDTARACKDIKQGIQCLRTYSILNPYTINPEMLQRILQVAISNNIEANYADKIARHKLQLRIFPGKEPIPILSIQTMGAFSVSINDTVLLQTEDLPPNHRILIGLLIIAPDCKMGQEVMQVALWPDKSSGKSRGSMDTMLLRLRKIFAKAVAGYPVKNYINLQKGFLSLKNCRIDVLDFTRDLEAATQHYQKKEFWQAGIKYSTALDMFAGEFLPGINENEAINDFRYETTQLFINAAIEYAKILRQTGHFKEAIKIAEQALRYDRFHDGPVSLLYHLHQQTNQPLKAEHILFRYKDLLSREAYSPDEIDVIVHSIMSPDK